MGSVVVRHGRVIGEGAEATRGRLDPSAHAEVEAIREACRAAGSLDLSCATLYTTVEPCFLCDFVIRTSRIERVVVGTDAGEVGSLGSKYPLLADPSFRCWGPPPKVATGVLEEESRAPLEGADAIHPPPGEPHGRHTALRARSGPPPAPVRSHSPGP